MHVLAGTGTMKMPAPGVADGAVGDTAMFESLLGQAVDTGGAGEGDDTRRAETPAAPGLGGGPKYGNLLASGVPPPASFLPGAPGSRTTPDLLPGMNSRVLPRSQKLVI